MQIIQDLNYHQYVIMNTVVMMKSLMIQIWEDVFQNQLKHLNLINQKVNTNVTIF